MPPPPEDEELDIGEDEELDEEDMEEGMDAFDALGSLLATEDGETVAQSLAGLKEAAEKIALGVEMQNKILIKILSEMKNSKCACPAPAPSDTPSA